MILVDTSVWVDHLRAGDAGLVTLLQDGGVAGHPWVTGELSLGSLANRGEVVRLLGALPQGEVASPAEIAVLVSAERLYGLGIGYVDVGLLASARLAPGWTVWTRDTRLRAVARRLGVHHDPPG